jgi:hypothetical protein
MKLARKFTRNMLSPKILSVILVLLALSAYALACGPGECVYAGLCYSDGACRGSQICINGTWFPKGQACIQP